MTEITKCKKLVSDIIIKHLSQKEYIAEVNKIFEEVFGCPDKLEPKPNHLPEKSRKIIQQKYNRMMQPKKPFASTFSINLIFNYRHTTSRSR